MEGDRQSSAKEDDSSLLEQFRQQWREEVSARTKQGDKRPARKPQPRRLTAESSARSERPINRPPERHPLADSKDDDEPDEAAVPQSGLIEKIEGLRAREVDEDDFSDLLTKEPKSALEHYERAVEKESQGNLGDSLAHYRTAYRLDSRVDQTYKNKHFPGKSKPSGPNPHGTSVIEPETAHQSSEDPTKSSNPPKLSLPDLIATYAGVEIPNAEPVIKGEPPPPCCIKKLPAEVLMEVLQYIASNDPAVFTRLALVCKRLAYHVFNENSIWKKVALGREFGLGGQQYTFATDVQGRQAIFQTLDEDESAGRNLPTVGEEIFPKSTDWREFFHSHPRIRFSGVYISTVNYTRAGGVSATPGTWNSTVHIVTYYRYLRFFRDGTLISLLTTDEPVEVVHNLTKENIQLVRSKGHQAPSANTSSTTTSQKEAPSLSASAQNTMKHALRGRWRLVHPSTVETTAGAVVGANNGVAGDIHIETEGVGPRYLYTLHLCLRSGSKSKTAVKNNKLVWKGFWSYNHLTDDWCEFHLKNDKAFWFSRVRSYGLGY